MYSNVSNTYNGNSRNPTDACAAEILYCAVCPFIGIHTR